MEATRDQGFEEYAAARWPRLVRSAGLLGADPHAAEDLVQQVLTRCYHSWDRVQRAGDADAYVHRMLVNAHIDSRRRRWWGERPTAELPESPGPDEGDALGSRDAVRQALARLGVEQRQVVVLRYYADLSEQQTADALGIAVGTVKSRASRALRALEDDPHLVELQRGGAG